MNLNKIDSSVHNSKQCITSNKTHLKENAFEIKKIKYTREQERENNWPKNTKLDVKAVTTLFLQKSSIYILNRIGNSRSGAAKVFWVFILLMSIIGLISQVILFLDSYYEYPVITNIMEELATGDRRFPTITFCNVNRVRMEFEQCVESGPD